MNNNNQEESSTSEELDPSCLFGDIDNGLSPIRTALLSLGALISGNNFELFSGDSGFGLRYGIKEIIEMCVDREETVLEEHSDLWEKTAYCLYLKAKKTLNSERYIEGLPHGWKRAPTAAKEIKKAIENLNKVIETDQDLREKAEELKVKCINALKHFRGK